MFARCATGESRERRKRAVRVAFDTRPASDPHGLGRYARCLLGALHDTASASDEMVDTHRPSVVARSRGADVFHSPWLTGAMLHSPCPTVVTIHGLAALKRRSEHLRTGLRLRLRHLAVQRAACVIVPTQAVAEDAVTHLRLERERIVVIPEAADAAMYPRPAHEVEAVRHRFGLPERYLVWVGGLQHPDPARHVAELAAAPRDLPLVLVGSTRPWAHELPGVTLTGRVSDEHLAAIYSGAHALVLPSEGEGFGLPAVEALACGTPVVAFASPALLEVLGGRAQFVPPGDMEALIEAAQAARRPAPTPASWTWEDAARATWGVYTRALAPTGEAHGSDAPLRRRTIANAQRIDGCEPQ
jgi:glycosyltransferase involved in cell wall biosynthesis